MKYVVNKQWFSLDDGFRIVDERGREACRLDGGAFGVGEKISFRDHRDNELAFISQKMLSSGPAYEIYHGDDLQAVVRTGDCGGKRCMFIADAPAPDDLHAEGNLGGREYTFTREGRPVGRVSHAFSTAAGTYGVEVGRGEDEILLLASAMVIDLCYQRPRAG